MTGKACVSHESAVAFLRSLGKGDPITLDECQRAYQTDTSIDPYVKQLFGWLLEKVAGAAEEAVA